MKDIDQRTPEGRRIFPALSHAPFRWFWCAQIVSLIGAWTQNVGQAWLVLLLTNSPFLLGLVSALQFMPMLFFSLHAGVWIDRLPKRRILVLTQTILMVLAFALAFLVRSGLIRYWMLAVVATVGGITNTIDMPAHQSFIVELVGKEHLPNAIALNSAIFNVARIVGPAVAGTIMGLWGVGWCFIINGLSFVGVILVLAFLPGIPQGQSVTPERRAVWAEIKEGLQYIQRTPLILDTLLIAGFLNMVVMNFSVLIPVLAKMDLHEEVLGFSLLMSSMGFGALAGALSAALSSGRRSQQFFLWIGSLGLGCFSIIIAFQTTYLGAGAVLALIGWSMLVFSASANSLIQITVDNRLRGRIMSVYALMSVGTTPVGSLLAGSLAHFYLARKTFAICGGLTLLFLGVSYLTRKRFEVTSQI